MSIIIMIDVMMMMMMTIMIMTHVKMMAMIDHIDECIISEAWLKIANMSEITTI